MPSGCKAVLSEPGSEGHGKDWFDDHSSANEAWCTKRETDFNTDCSRKDAMTHWGKSPPGTNDAPEEDLMIGMDGEGFTVYNQETATLARNVEAAVPTAHRYYR